MNKKLLVALSVLSVFMFLPLVAANGAAGTTANIHGPSSVKTNAAFMIEIVNLEDGADYVLSVDSTTYGLANYTFTADGTNMYYKFKFTSDGTNTISVGGATDGVAASAIDSIKVRSDGFMGGIIDNAFFTNLVTVLLPILIVAGIVGVFIKKQRSS